MRALGIRIDDELHKQIRLRVVELNTNIKDYVTYLIKKDLEKKKE